MEQHVGTDVISAGFPCQAFSRVGHRQGYNARGQVIFHLIQLCWVFRPRFMVLECVWPFFENPLWVEPVCEYFRGMGYGISIRKEQASNYLAQVRTRGILTATRADHWGQAMGPLRALFIGSLPPRHATVGFVGVLGPHSPEDSPLYFSEDQIRRYSPGKYLRDSWPWGGYTRTLKGESVLPTILRPYGWTAETFAASNKGWHGFFADTPRGPRFFSPRELAVAQGFPWGFTLPGCRTQAWQLLGNFVPPPMAYLGLIGPAVAICGVEQGMPSADWAAEGFRRCCQASDGAWERVLEPGPGARTARSPTRSRFPPGHRKQPRADGSFLAIGRPRWPSPRSP